MIELPKPLYFPTLRMKTGELEGVRQLADDVALNVLPRFIVPPKGERDERTPLLIDVEEMPDISVALRTHWRQRPVLIDATHIIDEYGRDRLSNWLPAMFERARNKQVRAIPMALLADLRDADAPAFRAAIAVDENIKFAICIPSAELVRSDFDIAITGALERLGLTPQDCAALVDFGGSEFGDPAVVAPIIAGALEMVQDLGTWQQIVFQGTHYPETNPAEDGSAEAWPRNEWLAWRQATNLDSATAEHMTFGDYAADCAKMKFGSSGVAAIRHIRYATADSWLIQRAVKSGSDTERMHGVYKAIFGCREFAGRGFSKADEYIASAAQNPIAKPGNASTWRQLNTTHHITQVVADIAKMRGITIREAQAVEFDSQPSLLE